MNRNNSGVGRTLGTVLAFTIASGATRVGATDQSKYEGHVAKFATPSARDNLNPRFMCVCQEPAQNAFRVGYMVALPVSPPDNASGIMCFLPRFDANGARATPEIDDLCDRFVPMRR